MQNRFQAHPRRVERTTPRKVRGGVRLAGKEGPEIHTWVGRRWMRFIEEHAPAEKLAEGLEYASAGQTRKMRLEPGKVVAAVQGLRPRSHDVELRFARLSHDEWDRVCQSMADQALYSAKLLSGELPVSVEDIFAPLDLRLFPVGDAEVVPVTDDREAGWTTEACCVALLLAEALEKEPFLIFRLRGLEPDELTERIRQRRAVVGSSGGAAPAYSQRPVPGADAPSPLSSVPPEDFWSAPVDLSALDTPLDPPRVSHPLLRRLGQSPFEGSRFPLVGLLATCYDVIAEMARREESAIEAEVSRQLEASASDDAVSPAGDPAAR